MTNDTKPTGEAKRDPASKWPATGGIPGSGSFGEALKDLNIGQRLALARHQRGMTQKQLSELVGKSRATIIQYEQGRLQPPVQQIEVMASVLRVSPELIAFGRQGITGLPQGSTKVASLPEVRLETRDGQQGQDEQVSGGYGFAEDLVDQFGIERIGARVFVVADSAPAFELASGDRIIVNPEPTLRKEARIYAFRGPNGLVVARVLPSFTDSPDDVNLNGPYGETRSCKRGELTVLGLIVGTIRAC